MRYSEAVFPALELGNVVINAKHEVVALIFIFFGIAIGIQRNMVFEFSIARCPDLHLYTDDSFRRRIDAYFYATCKMVLSQVARVKRIMPHTLCETVRLQQIRISLVLRLCCFYSEHFA